MYDAQIGRWMVQDKFSEQFITLTPYNYAANNPIINVDIKGNIIAPWWLLNTSNSVYPGTQSYDPYISKYQNFITNQSLAKFQTAFHELIGSNRIFHNAVARISWSKQTYHINELYESSDNSAEKYDGESNTIGLYYNRISKDDMVEEFFHERQDDYYGEKNEQNVQI